MARTIGRSRGATILPAGAVDFLRRRAAEGVGLVLIAASAALGAALLTYSATDPSWNNATDGLPRNLLGAAGATVADLLLQSLGLAAAIPALVAAAWGGRALLKRGVSAPWLRIGAMATAMLILPVALAVVEPPAAWPVAAGLGGSVGALAFDGLIAAAERLVATPVPAALGLAIGALGAGALAAALGITVEEWLAVGRGLARWTTTGTAIAVRLGAALGRIGRSPPPAPQAEPPALTDDGPPAAAAADRRRTRSRNAVVAPPKVRLKTGRKAKAAGQGSLDLDPDGSYRPPPLHLLEPPEAGARDAVSRDALEQNAELLATVLDDFGVRGDIAKVRPGPVITLYELEPAPGTKTSRVIGLSDDIARSMSAVSVRAAVVPGRNVIGIELPNTRREMVTLRELLASEPYERSAGKLTLALGKDIGGAPVLVDLARMPHLLIAGTTGSGKSVAINTMILSLLYRLPPEECRFILVDPKMLELSVYEGIPHLLCPVVTEASKAVVALKWTVREMEERYRAMSQLGVRNIAGYNGRLAEARRKGEALTRRVQTGFDADGRPVFEEQALSTDPLPFIVVVVDEMADLMLVAGKDIEAAVQRLAQMARAAGIHLVMATQRPSVDVITGTIKANFPTRVSFQVTSKVDSRTILGEQGAEQLLGQGDMLYMAGGGRITRVHGPFVSDTEVEGVVEFLKAQGAPAYVDAVTEEDDDGPGGGPLGGGDGPSGDTLYDEAVAIVAREGKASTSFIQRHLQIGYNRAARIIERMERDGVVTKANRVGRREVLIGDHGR